MTRQKSPNPIRRSNRLKDEVYREMYLLESKRPGSEMGLALALLRAWNEADRLAQDDEIRVWLRQVCPMCVKMIEDSLEKGCAGWPLSQ
jgi:hypothetical protein